MTENKGWYVIEKWAHGKFVGYVQESDSPEGRFGSREHAMEIRLWHAEAILERNPRQKLTILKIED